MSLRKDGLKHRRQWKWVKWCASVGKDKVAQRNTAGTSGGGWTEGLGGRSGLGTDMGEGGSENIGILPPNPPSLPSL